MSMYFPNPEPREYEALRVGDSAASGIVLIVIVGIVFGGVGTTLGFHASEEFGIIGYVFAGIFALIGLVCFGGAISKSMAASKLAPPTVTLSVQPLFIGETLHGQFHQQVRKQAEINAVTLKLICRERVRYQQGTDTRTDTMDVISIEHTLPISGQVLPTENIEGEFEFTVPDHAMHSFTASDNHITWLLEIHTDVTGWPDYESKVDLEVAPRYAPTDEEF